MSNMVKTGLYEEDLHGNSPANLIPDEVHTLQVPSVDDYYFIIPRAAPFFVASLKVYNHQTGVEYKENIDYTIGHRFIEAMDSIGRPIAGSVRFMRRDIVGQARLRYQTVGGNWGYDDAQILEELSRRQYNPITRVWGNIGPLPYSFPPLIHDQSLDTLVGSEDLNESLTRIGDILEATASGTTESHLRDFNNPHQVTKTQVELGSVNNYATATEAQHVEGTRTDLYATPRGTKALIDASVGNDLTAHLNDKENPHDTTKTHVGLGDVANYPPATALEAIDVLRNDRYLTPYTGSLLIQKIQNDPRLEQLLIDFNNHIGANNPHGITPAMIGSLSEQEILDLLARTGGGDAGTFGGLTPEEWLDLFPWNEDLIGVLDSIKATVAEGELAMTAIDVPQPAAVDLSKMIITLAAHWDGYTVANTDLDTLVKGNSAALIAKGNAVFTTSSKDAGYAIDPASGKILFTGSRAIDPQHLNAVVSVFANDNALIWQLKGVDGLGALEIKPRGMAKAVIVPAGQSVTKVISHPGITTTKLMVIADYMDSNNAKFLVPYGDATWVSLINGIVAQHVGKSLDFAIGQDHLVLAIQDRAVNKTSFKVWKINYTGVISLSEITNTFSVVTSKGVTKTFAAIATEEHTIGISGLKDKFILLYMDEGEFALLDVNKPSAPAWDIPLNSKHGYFSIAAGNDYILTLNNKGFVNFWGNSPDNSLFIPSINTIRP